MPIAKPHPVFLAPGDPEVKIWRYLDFAKYVSVLSGRGLFLCRVDKLDDPFEGVWPRPNVDDRPKMFWEHFTRYDYVPEEERQARIDEANVKWIEMVKAIRCHTAVNCWNMSEYESAAMWDLYVGRAGVALQSTYSRLAGALQEAPQDIYIGVVRYVDFSTEVLPTDNMLAPITCKRKSFEHEAELRAVIVSQRRDEEGRVPAWEDGVTVGVDLERLVENVYVSPVARPWFADLVKSVSERYGLKAQVVHSSLAESPIY